MARDAEAEGAARYVFRVGFRLDSDVRGLSVEPSRFEATVYRMADPPGEEGWLFFRDNLWRGELADPDHFRTVTEEALGVPVVSVSFRELQTDEAQLGALREAVGANLDEFRADSVDRALSKYLGSSIRVVQSAERATWFGSG